MRVHRVLLTTLAACAAVHLIGQGAAPADDDATEIAHLPIAIQRDILAWRERLESAACIKVVCDTEQTWELMHELDADGNPVLARRERFQTHAWMTPDMLWMTVFAYEGAELDTATPYSQLLWDREAGLVRERYWIPDEHTYRVLRYEDRNRFGPANANVADCRGCVYATAMNSWVVGGPRLADRSLTVRSVALLRKPNIAVVPPDPTARGVWLDVFRDEIERDRKPGGDSLYRRNDFMLLSRASSGYPEVSEWRTIVMTDHDAGGASPTQIAAVRRLSYQLYGSIPGELLASTRAFARDIDGVAAPLKESISPERATSD